MCLEAVAIESTFGLDACEALKALALSQTQGYLERVAHVLSVRQVSSAGVRRFCRVLGHRYGFPGWSQRQTGELSWNLTAAV